MISSKDNISQEPINLNRWAQSERKRTLIHTKTTQCVLMNWIVFYCLELPKYIIDNCNFQIDLLLYWPLSNKETRGLSTQIINNTETGGFESTSSTWYHAHNTYESLCACIYKIPRQYNCIIIITLCKMLRRLHTCNIIIAWHVQREQLHQVLMMSRALKWTDIYDWWAGKHWQAVSISHTWRWNPLRIFPALWTHCANLPIGRPLKRKGSHIDYFVFTGYTWGGNYDHLKCNLWIQNSQRDYLSVSVISPLSGVAFFVLCQSVISYLKLFWNTFPNHKVELNSYKLGFKNSLY